MKKIIITGSSGMLGSNLVQKIGNRCDIFGTYRDSPNPELGNNLNVDLTDAEKVRDTIGSIRPDFVVHCAALTNVDRCEEDYEFARNANALAVKNILSSLGPKKRFIHISTDSIFDGKSGNYSESNMPSPINNYARTKLEGEGIVERNSCNYVIVRTNMFGWNRVKGESFAEWIINNLSRNNPIRMFADVIFSPLAATFLASYIIRLLDVDFTGKLHIGSRDSISKYGFGLKVAEVFGFDKSLISPVSIDELHLKAPRPKNTSLDISKARTLFGELPTIDEGMTELYNTRDISVEAR
jgi:dTDP-4-dehydrorhamnose reductase